MATVGKQELEAAVRAADSVITYQQIEGKTPITKSEVRADFSSISRQLRAVEVTLASITRLWRA